MADRISKEKGLIEERTINDKIGDVLRGMHPQWSGDKEGCIITEKSQVLDNASGKRPDIVVWNPGGMPVVIESEFHPAREVEEKDARPRLGETLSDDGEPIEQVIALRIPKHLKKANQAQAKLLNAVIAAQYEFCVISDKTEENPKGRWPEKGWIKGGVEDLATFIEHASMSENRIEKGMSALEKGVARAANILRRRCSNSPKVLDQIAVKLHQEDGEQTSRMAMAIVANALSFHTSIARTEGADDIEAIEELRGDDGELSKEKMLDAWRRIRSINYRPIFKIAEDIMKPIRNSVAQKILNELAKIADHLDSLGATTQHDLSGRMFQRLIADRKFLATFYTRPSSAALLAEIAVSRMNKNCWKKKNEVTRLRVGDFACGTGALLNASYGAMMARYRKGGADDSEIHATMIENVLYGTDIMPAATHLTTSVLSSAHPTKKFGNTNIVTLPFGVETEQLDEKGEVIYTGALDLIVSDKGRSLFSTGHQEILSGADRTPDEEDNDGHESIHLPQESFDLVIMNPPFTRNTGQEAEKVGVPNPMFAGLNNGVEEQKKMTKELRRIYRMRNAHRSPSDRGKAGHGNAGLASNFMDLADEKIKDGGVLALIVLATFVSGSAWSGMRDLLNRRYRDITIVSIVGSGPGTTSFSADTGMSEVLIIATREKKEKKRGTPITYVDLARRPVSILEAVEFGKMISGISRGKSEGLIHLGTEQRVGRFSNNKSGFATSSGVKISTVANFATMLGNGILQLPQFGEKIEIPIVPLRQLGTRGRYHQDIIGEEPVKLGLRGPFCKDVLEEGDVPEYPMLWAHHADSRKDDWDPDKWDVRMRVEPDCQAVIREGANHEQRAKQLWKETASRVCFNRDFGFSSNRLAACRADKPLLGGRAWPNFKCCDTRHEYPIVLWMNTTLGLISFWWKGTRQMHGRSSITVTQLPSLPIYNMCKLDDAQLGRAEKMFEEYSKKYLLPAVHAHQDDVRKDLDKAVLVDLLGLPSDILESLELLREMWCAEPSVKRKNKKGG